MSKSNARHEDETKPPQAAFFVPISERNIINGTLHRVGSLDNTPKVSAHLNLDSA